MTSEKEKKEDEMYGESAVDGYNGEYENIDPMPMEAIDAMVKKNLMMDRSMTPPQNPLAEMMKGLTGMLTASRPQSSQKLTLSGIVGESQINVEITDTFTATMAHDVINKVIGDLVKKELGENRRSRRGEEEKEPRGVSEEDMFRHLSSRGKKLTD